MEHFKKIIHKHNIFCVVIAIICYFIFVHIISLNANLDNQSNILALAIIAVIILNIAFLFTNMLYNKRQKNIDKETNKETSKKNEKKESKESKNRINIAITYIIILGLILRTAYILYTKITDRGHDILGGHLEYIKIIYETGKLPDSYIGQFYHQPLHHIISAIWLRINSSCGVYYEDFTEFGECVQILTAIYSSMVMVITYCILKELRIKDKYKIIVMLIMAVHPTFIILSRKYK